MTLANTDHAGFKIDTETGVVINTNTKDLASYKKQVADALAHQKLQSDFDSLLERVRLMERLLMANER